MFQDNITSPYDDTMEKKTKKKYSKEGKLTLLNKNIKFFKQISWKSYVCQSIWRKLTYVKLSRNLEVKMLVALRSGQ